jgi:hypothetical protein
VIIQSKSVRAGTHKRAAALRDSKADKKQYQKAKENGICAGIRYSLFSLNKEASQARGYCVAKYATLRVARPNPSLRQKNACSG